MKYSSVLVFLLLQFIGAAQSGEYSRVKIDLQNTSLSELAKLGLEVDHGQIKPGVFIINDFHRTEIYKLEELSINYEILIDDVQDYYLHREDYHDHEHVGISLRAAGCEPTENEIDGFDYKTPENYRYGTMGGYLTYEKALENIDSMRILYPNLISVKTQIGDILTHEGRPIYSIRISDNPDHDEDEPEVLYTSLHHAREPNSLAQNLFYMWYLLENYATDEFVKYLVDNTEMYFVPIVNPDGYVYNELINPQGGGLWRKNRRADPNELPHGVDLNRNYGYFWGFDNEGSSGDKEDQTYRGPSGFSEPETQAVKLLCESHNFILALNYHTYGNLLAHPWGYSDLPTDEDELYKTIGNELIRYNKYILGTGTETFGYVTNGDADDYMYGEQSSKNKIYSMTPEVGHRFDGFWPSSNRIDQLNKENMHQNLSLAAMTLNHGISTINYDKEASISGSGMIAFEIKKLGFQDGNLTVRLNSLGSDLFPDYEEVFSLNQTESIAEEIVYQLPVDAAGDYFFVFSLDNGDFVKRDTYMISAPVAVNGVIQSIFKDSMNNFDAFESFGSWGVTTEDFVSDPSSMTDSPNSNYRNNANEILYVKEPLYLFDALESNLMFKAKWDIEADYDYVQVQASIDQVNWTALCGTFTEDGVGDQPNEPVYDGVQDDWVDEIVNLDTYNGHTAVWLRFRLISDGGLQEDGFYFDDMNIEIKKAVTSSSEERIDASLSVYPNPVDSDLSFKFDKNILFANKGEIYNQNSQVVLSFNSEEIESGRINVQSLPIGIYFLKLNKDQKYAVVPFVKK